MLSRFLAVCLMGLVICFNFSSIAYARTIHLTFGECKKISKIKICANYNQPTPFQIAIKQIQDEVVWAEKDGVPDSYGKLVSQAALQYVVGHVSSAEYGYLQIFNLPLPGVGTNGNPSPNEILSSQAGICGDSAIVMAALMHYFNIPVRSIQFYYNDPSWFNFSPDSHIAVETFYDGGWHFYDPTFGVYWQNNSGDILQIKDIRNGLGSMIKDEASFTNFYETWEYHGDDIWFETSPQTIVVINGQKFNY